MFMDRKPQSSFPRRPEGHTLTCQQVLSLPADSMSDFSFFLCAFLVFLQ